ncbi:MAG: hypothetical protein ACKOX6_09680 [Bdellovibrio sp.]
MAAFYKHILLISMAALLPLNSMAQFACQDVFAPESTYYNEAIDKAVIQKLLEKGTHKLSPNDLTKLVHNMFNKYEGQQYQVSHYLQMTAGERTKAILFRQVSETVTRRGLETFFRENGMLIDSSSLMTKLWVINRSKSFNLFSAIGATLGLARGNAPIFLPEVFLQLKPHDLNTLLLKGLESKEGLEISNRYGFKQEVIRGYSLANRYYTRVAIAVVFFMMFDKVEDFLTQDHDSIPADIWTLFLSELQTYKENIP